MPGQGETNWRSGRGLVEIDGSCHAVPHQREAPRRLLLLYLSFLLLGLGCFQVLLQSTANTISTVLPQPGRYIL